MKQNIEQITGDYTIGYEGSCIWCKQNIKAYYLYADVQRRRAMKAGTFMSLPAHCPSCVTKIGASNSIKWIGRLSQEEVINDLSVYERGGKIDFKGAKQKIQEDEKMDKIIDNEEYEMQEKLKWARKKLT